MIWNIFFLWISLHYLIFETESLSRPLRYENDERVGYDDDFPSRQRRLRLLREESDSSASRSRRSKDVDDNDSPSDDTLPDEEARRLSARQNLKSDWQSDKRIGGRRGRRPSEKRAKIPRFSYMPIEMDGIKMEEDESLPRFDEPPFPKVTNRLFKGPEPQPDSLMRLEQNSPPLSEKLNTFSRLMENVGRRGKQLSREEISPAKRLNLPDRHPEGYPRKIAPSTLGESQNQRNLPSGDEATENRNDPPWVGRPKLPMKGGPKLNEPPPFLWKSDERLGAAKTPSGKQLIETSMEGLHPKNVLKDSTDDNHAVYLESIMPVKSFRPKKQKETTLLRTRSPRRSDPPFSDIMSDLNKHESSRMNEDSMVLRKAESSTGSVETGKSKGPNSKPNSKQTKWMNLKLLVDDSGQLKVKMDPEQPFETKSNRPRATQMTKTGASTSERKEANPQAMFSSAQAFKWRETPTSKFERPGLGGSAGTSAWNAPVEGPLDKKSSPADTNINQFHPSVPTVDFSPPLFNPPKSEPPPVFVNSPVDQMPDSTNLQPKWNKPKLLFEKVKSTLQRELVQQSQSNAKSDKLNSEISTVESEAIPAVLDIDNPLLSGCKREVCSKKCPGDLRKLSPKTGCPTCECCPVVECKTVCSIGYDADDDGCPTCKCSDQST
ncbi:histone acetyltransferase MYST4 [Clonorchis sinensis]|uniref:Histone acetyltransferase MYST4 n=1 Tax=Clonorchis sinensis TaxID=79923 RepID=H2KQ23_CLOSI|nr:histone acetyltransferase MYST4 [Clonorchis sinensis]